MTWWLLLAFCWLLVAVAVAFYNYRWGLFSPSKDAQDD